MGIFDLFKGKKKAKAVSPNRGRPIRQTWQPIDQDVPASSDYGDSANFYVTKAARRYNNNSVSALFRLHRLPDGFVTTWRQFCVARNTDGSFRWKLNGFGKKLAVSPDGTRIAVSQASGGVVAIVGTGTGTILAQSESLAQYVSDVAWTADGQRLLVNASTEIIKIDVNGAELSRYTDFPDSGESGRVFTSLLSLPDERFVVSHPNAKMLLVINEATGAIESVEEKRADNLFLAPSGNTLWIGSTGGTFISSLPGLEPSGWFKMPGKLGVRHEGQDEWSYTQFQPIPRVSEDDKVVLLNDRSGQLWLLSRKGTAYYRWPREEVDAVEDTMWVDEMTFLVATNDRRIRRMRIDNLEPEFDVVDS